MKKLYDPVSGLRVELYASRGESDEVYRAQPEAVIRTLALHYDITEDEAERRLVNSDVDAPVTYNDEVFWVE